MRQTATVEMILISEVLRFGLLKELYALIKRPLDFAVDPPGNPCRYGGILASMALHHLAFMMERAGDDSSAKDLEGHHVMEDHLGKALFPYPECFNAWVVAGCPNVNLMELEKLIVDAAGSHMGGLFPPVDPADFAITMKGSQSDEGLIADALLTKRTTAMLLAMVEAGAVNAGPTAPFVREDAYSQRLTAMAVLHLRCILAWHDAGGIVEGEDNVIGIETPYAESFKAWVLDFCPGLGRHDNEALSDVLYRGEGVS